MATRIDKPVTVTLGGLLEAARQRVVSGRYASLSEVVRAGLRALDREEAALDAVLRARVDAALTDPAPSVEQGDVFRELRERHQRRA